MTSEMPSNWPRASLGELASNFDGRRVPVRKADRRPGPYAYYGASGVVDYVDGYLFDGDYLLVAEDGENLRTRATPIAFAARGRFWVNNHAHVLQGNRKADTHFLMYALRATDISGYLTGTTLPKLTQQSLKGITLALPSLGEQRAIVSVLGALDDKIDLNARMNDTLDALATALFDRALDQAPSDGAPEVPLGDHIEAVRGLSYTGAGLGNGLPLHNLNSIREGGGYKRDGIKYYAGEHKERHVVRPGDIVVANTEQAHTNTLIGYPAIVPARFGEVGLFSQDLYRVRIRESSPLMRSFLYLLLRSEPLRSSVAGYRNGTTVSHLPAVALVRPTFTLPPADRIRALDAQVTPLLAKIEANEDENDTLAALRDALLPRLISGELRVRPSGAVVAATA